MLYLLLKSSILQSLVIRSFGLIGRLVLLIVTVRNLTTESLGIFNLAQAGIGIFSLFAGLELVQFLNRSVANQPEGQTKELVSQYFFMTLPLVTVSTIAFGAFTFVNLLPKNEGGFSAILFLLFGAVFLFEHYNNEIQRILIAARSIVVANIILLIRAGLWPFGAVLFVLVTGELDLYSILTLWGGASGVAAFFGMWFLSRLGAFSRIGRPSSRFVKAAFMVSIPLFVGMLFQRSPFFLDKYFLSGSSYVLVGNYSVMLSLSLILRMLFEASMLAYFTPQLLRSEFVNGPHRKIISVYGLAMGFTGVLGLMLFVARGPLLAALDKAYLMEYSYAFGALIIAVCLVSVSLISTLILIARQQQNRLLMCDLLYFGLFLSLMIAGFGSEVESLSYAHLFSSVLLAGLKLLFVVRWNKTDKVCGCEPW